MTCHDAREQFSALVDDALATGERAAVDAHLATCADCRRELQRFRDTVALVRAVAPARAPAGFVDRVLEAAHPAPWYRRLARALFLPWPVKLPMEAAAIVLVAVGVALVYRGSPELRQAAHYQEAEPTVTRAPESTPPPATAREADALRDTRGARGQDEPKQPSKDTPATPQEPALEKKLTVPPAPAVAQQPMALSRDAEPQQAPERREKPDTQAGGKPEALPTVAEREQETVQRFVPPEPAPAPKARADASAARRSLPAAAGMSFTAPDVSGRLEVSDREAALGGVAELVKRLGAVETRRVEAAEGLMLELTVPRDAYAEFTRELARLGRWEPTTQQPSLPAQIRVVLLIIR
jgi:hypothetical protein